MTGACLVFGLAAGATSLQSREKSMPSISKSEIETVASRRIVFGHQSVGENILDGVKKLARKNGVRLELIETRKAASEAPGIFHFEVGQNGDPFGKIGDFEKTMSSAAFGKVDIALVKLCFVDITKDTDAVAVAKAYEASLKKLAASFPNTRFIAVTAPLTTIPTGLKVWVKNMIGRKSTDMQDNAKRKQFNDYLRKEFPADRLFDIARLEAEDASAQIELLRPDLSSDGGHLNDKGQRLVGAGLLKLLAAK